MSGELAASNRPEHPYKLHERECQQTMAIVIVFFVYFKNVTASRNFLGQLRTPLFAHPFPNVSALLLPSFITFSMKRIMIYTAPSTFRNRHAERTVFTLLCYNQPSHDEST